MEQQKLTIWTNAKLPVDAAEHLAAHVLPHRLLLALIATVAPDRDRNRDLARR